MRNGMQNCYPPHSTKRTEQKKKKAEAVLGLAGGLVFLFLCACAVVVAFYSACTWTGRGNHNARIMHKTTTRQAAEQEQRDEPMQFEKTAAHTHKKARKEPPAWLQAASLLWSASIVRHLACGVPIQHNRRVGGGGREREGEGMNEIMWVDKQDVQAQPGEASHTHTPESIWSDRYVHRRINTTAPILTWLA